MVRRVAAGRRRRQHHVPLQPRAVAGAGPQGGLLGHLSSQRSTGEAQRVGQAHLMACHVSGAASPVVRKFHWPQLMHVCAQVPLRQCCSAAGGVQ